jgi:hypothetical protein
LIRIADGDPNNRVNLLYRHRGKPVHRLIPRRVGIWTGFRAAGLCGKSTKK